MADLFEQLLGHGFPGDRERAVVIATTLAADGYKCIAVRSPLCSHAPGWALPVRRQDLSGSAHVLPFRKKLRHIPFDELTWLVQLAAKVSAQNGYINKGACSVS